MAALRVVSFSRQGFLFISPCKGLLPHEGQFTVIPSGREALLNITSISRVLKKAFHLSLEQLWAEGFFYYYVFEYIIAYHC
jgi:hypothetical protein